MNGTSPDPAWLAETQRRLRIDEGCGLTRYRDSMGIWTLGIGYNLERGDAPTLLHALGIDYAAVMAGAAITQEQADKLFVACFSPIIAAASASLDTGVFERLTDARRFVICDLVYQLGAGGWSDFSSTRNLISQAQILKNAGNDPMAHRLFTLVCQHLQASPWAAQSGDRAGRNIAMMGSGEWVDATGNGSSKAA